MLGIIRRMSDPHVSSAELEILFRKEPALVAKLLKAANSSYYGLRNPVSSVSAAIAVLGMKTVTNIVVSVAYQQTMATQHSKLFDRKSFWKHSLAVALLARAIAKRIAPETAEEYYLTGLLHDMGVLGLDRHCPAELDKILTLIRTHGLSAEQAEFSILGFDSTDVGAVMARQWRLGDRIVDAIAYHREPLAAESNMDAAQIVHMANAIANKAGCHLHSVPDAQDRSEECATALGIPEEFVAELERGIVPEVERTSQAYFGS